MESGEGVFCRRCARPAAYSWGCRV